MIKTFSYAKILTRFLAKKYNMKNMTDWNKFTNSIDFLEFKGVIPKNPAKYYSKKNVKKRLEVSEK